MCIFYHCYTNSVMFLKANKLKCAKHQARNVSKQISSYCSFSRQMQRFWLSCHIFFIWHERIKYDLHLILLLIENLSYEPKSPEYIMRLTSCAQKNNKCTYSTSRKNNNNNIIHHRYNILHCICFVPVMNDVIVVFSTCMYICCLILPSVASVEKRFC